MLAAAGIAHRYNIGGLYWTIWFVLSAWVGGIVADIPAREVQGIVADSPEREVQGIVADSPEREVQGIVADTPAREVQGEEKRMWIAQLILEVLVPFVLLFDLISFQIDGLRHTPADGSPESVGGYRNAKFDRVNTFGPT